MPNVSATRQAYKAELISNIGFVQSSLNLADGLTKPRIEKALSDLITTGRHTTAVEQWIVRSPL